MFLTSILLAALLFSGCYFAVGEKPVEKVISKVLVADDFEDDTAGNKPSKWDGNNVTVVDDLEAGGKSVQVAGDKDDAYFYKKLDADAPIVVFEFNIRWVSGTSGLNIYLDDESVRKAGGHNVNLFGRDGSLGYRYNPGTGDTEQFFHEMGDGWTRVKVAANAVTEETYIFVNDEPEPVLGPLPFRRSMPVPENMWEEIDVRFWYSGAEGRSIEVYFDDVRVTAYTLLVDDPDWIKYVQ